jgi:hypothetical protein
MIYYITKPNDTLQRISAKMYGDWSLWYLIFDNNRSLFPNRWSVQSGLMVLVPVPLTQDVTHRVVNGDSYSSLSVGYYGSEHYANKIKAINNGLVVGRNITIQALLKKSVYEGALSLVETGVSAGSVNPQIQVVVSEGKQDDKFAIFYNEFSDGLIGGV